MHLALVVPALNEEEAIASTLRRALAAREAVIAQTRVTKMTVVFVNDGSTDRTQEIVDQPEFDEVVKVRFDRNRGYGAAIKAGWESTDADLLGFIDADGTCDPMVCVGLVNRLEQTNADAVLAARLSPDSQMPLIRKVGNVLFARLLGLVSGRELTDSASGFRIVRRSSLRYMSPLPDGLHFTPAMSAICLLDPRLKLEEVPFTYRERIGRSKLSVFRDGVRFLYTILFAACCYTPIRTMFAAASIGILALAAAATGIAGLTGNRLASAALLGAGALSAAAMVATGVVCHELNYLLLGPRGRVSFLERAVQNTLHHRRMIAWGLGVTVLSTGGLVAVGLTSSVENVASVVATVALAALAVGGISCALGGVITRVIWAVGAKQQALLGKGHQVEEPVTGTETDNSVGGHASSPAAGLATGTDA